eukprot:3602663-Pyramimonas_sp.AAC.1
MITSAGPHVVVPSRDGHNANRGQQQGRRFRRDYDLPNNDHQCREELLTKLNANLAAITSAAQTAPRGMTAGLPSK